MLQRGAVLSGKYRIDGVLGEGGMAVVYAVTHLRNTARLAVKVLHEGSVLKGHIRARFVREGKVANSVNHPGAVQMIDDGVAEDGSPYLVMEHLSGVSVDRLDSRAIPLGAALNIAYQVLDVLRAAHENGIIHRDIKPANLFVLKNGRVKVLDFGISRLHDGAEPFDSQATGSVMGTPFFMAPEQARADAHEIDTRTDLFAVGATLFTLISGKFLHIGDDCRQVMIQAATQQARSLDSVAPTTPRAVVDLVAKAVAYDRAARWVSAEAMQEAVRQVHEALCGPLDVESLASLVLVREFRRKSHARLTAPRSVLPWASGHVDLSPLSTTLPAAAGVTRSVESFRNQPEADLETASSRLSAEPSELAGWTGQVPTHSRPRARASAIVSRIGGSLWKSSAVRLTALAVAGCTALLGFVHSQAPRASAVRHPASPELATPISVAHGVQLDTIADAPPLPTAPAWVTSAGPAPTPAPARGRRSFKPVAAPSPTTPPVPPAAEPVQRLKIAPVLIRQRDRSLP
ncbi:MAG TPA: serine/threonine-protein kinase [Polyangiaceae bacterium]|nr:serine/threonine-protein kinase [Polyangiaceae bacterium]